MEKIIIGMFYALFAGSVVAMQNVFSTRISEKVGLWETTVVVHFVGLLFALVLAVFFGDRNYKTLESINKFYLLAGALGVIIIYSVPMAIGSLGASFAISLMVIAQLTFSTIIDTFGLFGSDRIAFNGTKFIGLIIMVIGVIVFKLK